MSTLNRRRLAVICCAFALVAGLYYAQEIQAQVPTVRAPGRALQLVESSKEVPGNTNVDAFTVPVGRRLVLTDLVVSVLSNPTTIGVSRGGNSPIFLIVRITPDTPFHHSFATGPQFLPGQTVRLSNLQAGGTAEWYLTGYLTKL